MYILCTPKHIEIGHIQFVSKMRAIFDGSHFQTHKRFFLCTFFAYETLQFKLDLLKYYVILSDLISYNFAQRSNPTIVIGRCNIISRVWNSGHPYSLLNLCTCKRLLKRITTLDGYKNRLFLFHNFVVKLFILSV